MKKNLSVLVLLFFLGSISWADSTCDVNNDGKIGLEEAIYALQVVAGIKSVNSSVTNSHGMAFMLLEPGVFTMGSPSYELGRLSDETLHDVTLTNSFYIQTTEVTQRQWEPVMKTNPSENIGCADCPVENVSWDDVQAFITALNGLGEGTYRLPTEAEWEYACRAGSTTAFANGDITSIEADPNLDLMGWYTINSSETTHPASQKDPNAWGLYDMHGNVWEWCQDWYGPYPTGNVSDPVGTLTGPGRVFRGGSSYGLALLCRSAARGYGLSPEAKGFDMGFRLIWAP